MLVAAGRLLIQALTLGPVSKNKCCERLLTRALVARSPCFYLIIQSLGPETIRRVVKSSRHMYATPLENRFRY